MTWILLPMVFLLVMHVFIMGKPLGRLSPTSIFIYMQFIMAVGTVPTLDPSERADSAHGWLIFSTYTVFVGVSGVMAFLTKPPKHIGNVSAAAQSERWVRPRFGMIAMCLLSIAICIVYYSAIGYNVLAAGLGNAFSGDANDVASLRLEAYAGEEYYYPGYVNQFKNALLPALTCVIIPYAFVRKLPSRWVITCVLSVLTIVFILGTGQRGAFVVFMITIAVFVALMNREKLSRRMVLLAALSVPLFFISTVALGRSNTELSKSTGLLDQLQIIGGEIVFRILGSNQLASVAGFRYIYTRPPVNGSEWVQSLAGLLPGVPGSTLSNEIFSLLYGSSRGTAPPSIWGSFYYNFGLPITLILTVVMAIIYHIVSVRISHTPRANSLQCIGMAGVSTAMGTWVAGSPDFLMNVGIVVFIVLWQLGSWRERQRNRQARELSALVDAILPTSKIDRTPRYISGARGPSMDRRTAVNAYRAKGNKE
jgi:oligosaccharide repeat unit polymerase